MNPDDIPDSDLGLAWLDLSYIISGFWGKKSRAILNGITGRVNFGTMTAIMGPSGAGKTTLMNCIMLRDTLRLSNDTKFYISRYKKLKTCFITQNQLTHLVNGLTALESLIFASKLKNARKPKLRRNVDI